jgi:hypothetical protein
MLILKNPVVYLLMINVSIGQTNIPKIEGVEVGEESFNYTNLDVSDPFCSQTNYIRFLNTFTEFPQVVAHIIGNE